jgi:hypothetical protein
MEESKKVNEWCRFLKAQCTQDYKLAVLAHMDKGMRAQVLKKLGVKVGEDVFSATEVTERSA